MSPTGGKGDLARRCGRNLGAIAWLALLFGPAVPAYADDAAAPPLYRIVVEWVGPDDIDLLTSNPSGEVAWYHQSKQKDMELIRDSRGYLPSGADVPTWFPNTEETIIRGGAAGNCSSTVYFFENRSKKPVQVSVSLEKIGTPTEILHKATFDLKRRCDEHTLVGFHLDESGNLTDLNTLLVSVVALARVNPLRGGSGGGVCPLNWNPDVPCWGQEARN